MEIQIKYIDKTYNISLFITLSFSVTHSEFPDTSVYLLRSTHGRLHEYIIYLCIYILHSPICNA